jgi:hypothetical protein
LASSILIAGSTAPPDAALSRLNPRVLSSYPYNRDLTRLRAHFPEIYSFPPIQQVGWNASPMN